MFSTFSSPSLGVRKSSAVPLDDVSLVSRRWRGARTYLKASRGQRAPRESPAAQSEHNSQVTTEDPTASLPFSEMRLTLRLCKPKIRRYHTSGEFRWSLREAGAGRSAVERRRTTDKEIC